MTDFLCIPTTSTQWLSISHFRSLLACKYSFKYRLNMLFFVSICIWRHGNLFMDYPVPFR